MDAYGLVAAAAKCSDAGSKNGDIDVKSSKLKSVDPLAAAAAAAIAAACAAAALGVPLETEEPSSDPLEPLEWVGWCIDDECNELFDVDVTKPEPK